MGNNGFKLIEGRFRLGIGNNFFTMRVMTHWLLKEVVGPSSLEIFKARMDRILSTLV